MLERWVNSTRGHWTCLTCALKSYILQNKLTDHITYDLHAPVVTFRSVVRFLTKPFTRACPLRWIRGRAPAPPLRWVEVQLRPWGEWGLVLFRLAPAPKIRKANSLNLSQHHIASPIFSSSPPCCPSGTPQMEGACGVTHVEELQKIVGWPLRGLPHILRHGPF
jgi:hypothetical protein